jgi:hypothetical protein
MTRAHALIDRPSQQLLIKEEIGQMAALVLPPRLAAHHARDIGTEE